MSVRESVMKELAQDIAHTAEEYGFNVVVWLEDPMTKLTVSIALRGAVTSPVFEGLAAITKDPPKTTEETEELLHEAEAMLRDIKQRAKEHAAAAVQPQTPTDPGGVV